ncbi:GxxExxY protein [Rosistilla oblonga]|uniref:GxxExxY protein n=1 Tax=Rosistilla oblonga TaxID=2527990 RepID=UPI003A973375
MTGDEKKPEQAGDDHGPSPTYVPVSAIVARKDLADDQVNAICDVIRETGFAMHKYFGSGFREKVYERSLIHRLAKAGIVVDVQPRVMVHDEDGTELIEEIMDLIVERVLVVELKAVRQTTDTDVAQLLGYLKASSFRHGLLINFGAPKFYIKKYVL